MMKRPKPGAGRGQPPITKHTGKGGQQDMLPSRHAVSQLIGGDPVQRSLGNYSKLTPSGAGAPPSYQGIQDMASQGPTIPGMDDGAS